MSMPDPTDERALRVELLGDLRRAIPFDWYVWLLTDPVSGVGMSPLAAVPDLSALRALIKRKYLTATDRWTSMPAGACVSGLGSGQWGELVTGFGVSDILSAVLRDAHGCWGFIELWRASGTFTSAERTRLAEAAAAFTPRVRASLAESFAMAPPGVPSPSAAEPVVALLDDELRLTTRTPRTDEWLRALLPTASSEAPVPAAVYNVAAQLLANELGIDTNPPWARAHLGGGSWITLTAARLTASPGDDRSIVVTAALASPTERTDLYARVIGLTERETELLGLLVAGADTREVAARMFISEHTVQDHLKVIFAKSGTPNRRRLVARATGAA